MTTLATRPPDEGIPEGDLYSVLGIPFDAAPSEIDRAFRKLAAKWHPDRHPGDDHAKAMYDKIDEAYSVLGNAAKRAIYDRCGIYYGGGGQQNDTIKRCGEILSDLMMQMVDAIVDSGEDITKLDLCKEMTQALKASIREDKLQLQRYQKSLKALEGVRGRFEIEEGENLLEGTLAYRIQCAKQRIEMKELDIKEQQEALNYLKNYRYKFDPKTVGWETLVTPPWGLYPPPLARAELNEEEDQP